MNIQWFPGHMAKTRRLISENLKIVDIVIELLDARIPISSQNPILPDLLGTKPKIIALNKMDMADENATKLWIERFKKDGITAIPINSNTGEGFGQLKNAVNDMLCDKFKKDAEKGMNKRPPKMMVVGIPNVGKSSFINKLVGRASANTGDKPGITKQKQWIRIAGGFELLDTPGILWPKFEDDSVGTHLAFTGAIKDDIYEIEECAVLLCKWFVENRPAELEKRYDLVDITQAEPYDIFLEIGKKRGCVIRGGEIDENRVAHIILDDFRSLRLGNITLE